MWTPIRQHPAVPGALGAFVAISVLLALLYGSVRALGYFFSDGLGSELAWWITAVVFTACATLTFMVGALVGNQVRSRQTRR